jgi:hypothetical protein
MSLEEEALRINARWIHEVVERFDICPFARPALDGGHVARRVLVAPDEARALVDEQARDENVEVALHVFPTVTMSAAAFDAWCAPLRAANPAFVTAVFHPDTPYELSTPAQAVGFFRRAPDPTLQLVRVSALDAVRGRAGKFMFDFSPAAWAELKKREHRLPTSERIARDNHALVVRDGISTLQAIYDDIRADRDRSYGAAGGT